MSAPTAHPLQDSLLPLDEQYPGRVPDEIATEQDLVAVAVNLGAGETRGWSPVELAWVNEPHSVTPELLRKVRNEILAGEDPLGVAFCSLRSASERRTQGATYTPLPIVRSMLEWAHRIGYPDRIVDPGCGSGRFIVNAGRRFPRAKLVAVELDPVAAILTRANLAVSGLAARAEVIVSDFRVAPLRGFPGRTLYIGNPPYVRHHGLESHWKSWLTRTANARGLQASQLAGLHVHFFLATAEHAGPDDYGAYITAAEWLDVNYGALVRDLFLEHLGGSALHIIEPKAEPFPDAAATAAITCFHVATRPHSVKMRRVANLDELGTLEGGQDVQTNLLRRTSRWTQITRAAPAIPCGFVELGELCRVSRGQVTGANEFWIAGANMDRLPSSVLYPAVTKARELYDAGSTLGNSAHLRRVIDLPVDLDELDGEERKQIEQFLHMARAAGVHQGYVARHRKAWWSVGLYEPAPVLATYMARRPPGFVFNATRARHINIAHGIYPREPMSKAALIALANYLRTHTSVADGRTYSGGLTKFEPGEMERLLVPAPELLV